MAQLAWRPLKKDDVEEAPIDPRLLAAERAPAESAAADNAIEAEDPLLADDDLLGNDEPQLRLAL